MNGHQMKHVRWLQTRYQMMEIAAAKGRGMIINDVDALTQARCWEYRFVDELVVKRGSSVGFLNIKMALTKKVPLSSERITFHFDQCVEFRPDRMFMLSGLDLQIEPKRSAFFEEVRFRVFDGENRAFEFLCGSFIVETQEACPAML